MSSARNPGRVAGLWYLALCAQPALIGEIVLTLWLLIKSARPVDSGAAHSTTI
jgi:hypothetical protein